MVDNPREDILAIPQYPYIIFGDGYMALLVGGVERVDSDGRELVELQLIPEPIMRKRYNINNEQLNQNGVMTYIVLKKDLIPLNLFDKSKERWLYLKTYDRKETDVGKPSRMFRSKLEEAEKEKWMLEGDNIYLSEMVILARTNPAEFLSMSTEAFSKVTESVVDILNARKGREVKEE